MTVRLQLPSSWYFGFNALYRICFLNIRFLFSGVEVRTQYGSQTVYKTLHQLIYIVHELYMNEFREGNNVYTHLFYTFCKMFMSFASFTSYLILSGIYFKYMVGLMIKKAITTLSQTIHQNAHVQASKQWRKPLGDNMVAMFCPFFIYSQWHGYKNHTIYSVVRKYLPPS